MIPASVYLGRLLLLSAKAQSSYSLTSAGTRVTARAVVLDGEAA
jgi:hypothetical protein